MTSRPSPFLAGAVALLAFGLLGNAVGARDTLMSVADVRPGMVGVGRTVFKGAAIEEFTVRIIGTLKSVVAPQRDLILAKLEGGPLADTGVIAGMSGSPVYIDGKLLGAISYQLGQFPKEPIAGITPIAEMTDATALGAARALKPVSLPLGYPVPASDLVPLWRAALTPPSPFSAATGDLLGLAVSAGLPHRMSLDLRPITVPMTAGGFADGAIERLAPGLPGVSIVTTQASQTAASPTAPLAPGDAIGVALLVGRLLDRRHRHGDARGRRQGLRVRAPAVQPRSDGVSDDSCQRHRGAAQPGHVEQARQPRPRRRHDFTGSRHRDRRAPRRAAPARAGVGDADVEAGPQPHLQLSGRQRRALHAAADLSCRGQRAHLL